MKERMQLTLGWKKKMNGKNGKRGKERVELSCSSVHGLKSIELRSKSDSAAISRATCAGCLFLCYVSDKKRMKFRREGESNEGKEMKDTHLNVKWEGKGLLEKRNACLSARREKKSWKWKLGMQKLDRRSNSISFLFFIQQNSFFLPLFTDSRREGERKKESLRMQKCSKEGVCKVQSPKSISVLSLHLVFLPFNPFLYILEACHGSYFFLSPTTAEILPGILSAVPRCKTKSQKKGKELQRETEQDGNRF